MNKVFEGTPVSQISKCRSCRLAMNIRGLNLQERTICGANGSPMSITFPIVECSRYIDSRIPDLYYMEQIAWIVKSRDRGPVGFTDNRQTEITVEPPERIVVPQQPGSPTRGEK